MRRASLLPTLAALVAASCSPSLHYAQRCSGEATFFTGDGSAYSATVCTAYDPKGVAQRRTTSVRLTSGAGAWRSISGAEDAVGGRFTGEFTALSGKDRQGSVYLWGPVLRGRGEERFEDAQWYVAHAQFVAGVADPVPNPYDAGRHLLPSR